MRIYKNGDVIIGGFFFVYVCGGFRLKFMLLVEVMVFVVE